MFCINSFSNIVLLIALLTLITVPLCACGGNTSDKPENKNPDNRKAAVFIMLGQSNAVGHGTPMASEDIVSTPMKNVFGLHRDFNQSFTNTELKWTGYTTGGMNLGETQDNTWSVPNALAIAWQKAIDAGQDLPDLHIIQIAIGAQGVSQKYMWYPERVPAKQLIPGPLGTAKISLTPFTNHILSLVDQSFKDLDKPYEIMGIHWRGGENDFTVSYASLFVELKSIYERMFQGFRNSLQSSAPVILHNMVCYERADYLDKTNAGYRKNLEFINGVFEQLDDADAGISIFDITKYPGYNPEDPMRGLFINDKVHYTPEVNKWVAEQIMKEHINKSAK